MRRAVFLDRDGVINDAIVRNGLPYPPSQINEVVIKDNVYDLLIELRKKFLLIIVTNQPDVSRGTTSEHMVKKINKHIASKLPIDEVNVCMHDDYDDCSCRKPKPGLIIDSAKRNNIDLQASFMIGDRWKDIDAGKAAGCITIFINYNYCEPKPLNANYYVDSLKDAVQIIEENS